MSKFNNADQVYEFRPSRLKLFVVMLLFLIITMWVMYILTGQLTISRMFNIVQIAIITVFSLAVTAFTERAATFKMTSQGIMPKYGLMSFSSEILEWNKIKCILKRWPFIVVKGSLSKGQLVIIPYPFLIEDYQLFIQAVQECVPMDCRLRDFVNNV